MAKMSFLKKGKQAHAQVAQVEADAEARRAASDAPRRFWIPENKETQITFLDGDLDGDGLLSMVTYWEHQLKIGGHWRNWFPCTQVEEPCPICEANHNPSLVAAFTVIDHSEYKDRNGVTHKNEKRLFVCKRETLARLQKLATKRGGLTGVTFDVSRTGEKSAGVGDTFDFVEKLTPAQIKKKYGLDDAQPYDYDEVIVYRNAAELRKALPGVVADDGDDDGGVGSADAKAAADSVNDYEDEV